MEFVREAPDGTVSHVVVDETEYRQLAALVAGARAARALPLDLGETTRGPVPVVGGTTAVVGVAGPQRHSKGVSGGRS
ncbi:hypothetical protein [Streptomyces sp. KHY 26]|uniref:hypothetical protein n=1 Tax=Streptomyces sp. KHY 26 TaxID=3097359 RepID=UPI00376ECCC9